ncbi:MAG: XRE family transcriptional regulator [Deltaproteobacteria bacterium]|nr:MAG: XRE family transcriptional regulator [Deltaproteobacteria bacterium]
MSRPSTPLLQDLRQRIAERGVATKDLARVTGILPPQLDAILSGISPMTVDELLTIGEALELSPADFGWLDPEHEQPLYDAVFDEEEDFSDLVSTLDPAGNHAWQLFEIGFGLGCDFFFHADGQQLEGSGLPQSVIERYRASVLPIKLDAAYHVYNEPRYSAEGIELKLSFDEVYDCFFPWTAVQRVIFSPLPPPEPPSPQPDEEDDEPAGAPFLRLVE